jgi:D-sedoheptulose 7-phosphate isomerase
MNLVRELEQQVERVGQRWASCLKSGGKILLMGNGGSAADSQHIAAELVGRYMTERKGLAAIALTTDTSIITAVGNDYGYEAIFTRQIEALAAKGDIVIGYSTSGNSQNICLAMKLAIQKGCYTVGLTGELGGNLSSVADECVCIPSKSTPRIQEAHAFIGHMLCSIVDQEIAKNT